MHAVGANTAVINDPLVSIIEGVHISVILSCTSTGAPTPSIVWMLDGQPAPFIKNDIITRESEVHWIPLTSPPIFSITPGSITSYLEVVNARYPDHDGVYTCTGTNSYKMVNANSSVYISMQVLGKPLDSKVASYNH